MDAAESAQFISSSCIHQTQPVPDGTVEKGVTAISDIAAHRAARVNRRLHRFAGGRNWFVVLLALLCCCPGMQPQAGDGISPLQLVDNMAHAEMAAVKFKKHFLYRRQERSSRTKGHLWEEIVVEIPAGRMRRLVSVDGHPLTGSQKAAEDQRIQALVQHPDELTRDNEGRKEDEGKTNNILQIMPRAFLFTAAGEENGCIRVLFKPNPSYQEQSYQERVLHAASGTILIHPGDARLCRLDAHLDHQVEFGYGLLGRVSTDSGFRMQREQVETDQWKTTRIHVHVDGNIFMMKTVSRQEDSVHFGFQEVPYNMTVAESASLVRTTSY
jgi:hypothetical protein